MNTSLPLWSSLRLCVHSPTFHCPFPSFSLGRCLSREALGRCQWSTRYRNVVQSITVVIMLRNYSLQKTGFLGAEKGVLIDLASLAPKSPDDYLTYTRALIVSWLLMSLYTKVNSLWEWRIYRLRFPSWCNYAWCFKLLSNFVFLYWIANVAGRSRMTLGFRQKNLVDYWLKLSKRKGNNDIDDPKIPRSSTIGQGLISGLLTQSGLQVAPRKRCRAEKQINIRKRMVIKE